MDSYPTYKSNDVTVIIGYDHPDLLDVIETRKDPHSSGSPRALLTPFGWCVVGPVTAESGIEKIGCNVITITDPASIFNRRVEAFFLNDILSVKPDVNSPFRAEEKNALYILEMETQFSNRRHVVILRWQGDNVQLPENLSAARRRLQSKKIRSHHHSSRPDGTRS